MTEITDDMLTLLEHESQRQQERIQAMLIADGRSDVADWLAGKLRDVRLGLEAARGIWHALSVCQRVSLQRLARGDVTAARPATWEALIRRKLIEWRGRPLITEHGRFVVRHGPTEGRPLP